MLGFDFGSGFRVPGLRLKGFYQLQDRFNFIDLVKQMKCKMCSGCVLHRETSLEDGAPPVELFISTGFRPTRLPITV